MRKCRKMKIGPAEFSDGTLTAMLRARSIARSESKRGEGQVRSIGVVPVRQANPSREWKTDKNETYSLVVLGDPLSRQRDPLLAPV